MIKNSQAVFYCLKTEGRDAYEGEYIQQKMS